MLEIQELIDDILEESKAFAINDLKNLKSFIQPKLRKIVYDSIIYSEEGRSLLKGRMMGEFGLIDPLTDLEDIVKAISKAIIFEFRGENLYLGLFKSDFSDALGSEGSSYYSVSKSGDRTLVPWLEWLLFSGGQGVVEDHVLIRGNITSSRSGRAIMVENSGSSYTVRQDFSPGTSSNNWITNVAKALEPEILRLFQNIGGGAFNANI